MGHRADDQLEKLNDEKYQLKQMFQLDKLPKGDHRKRSENLVYFIHSFNRRSNKRLKTDIKDRGKLLGSIEIPVTSDMREAIENRSEFELRGTQELFDPDDPETLIGKVKWKFIVSDLRPLPKKVSYVSNGKILRLCSEEKAKSG